MLAVLLTANVARADLGQVQLSQTAGRSHITVLTPTPLYHGIAPISVFVQDAETRGPIEDATVEVSPRRRINASILAPTTVVKAVRDQDVAGPHYIARPYLSGPGKWQIDLAVDSHSNRETVSFICDVTATPPRWQTMWPWISWPPVVILLFVLREYTRSHGRAKPRAASLTNNESR